MAKRAEKDNTVATASVDEKKKDNVNWFGVEIGSGNSALNREADSGGVGKYLNLKRPQEGSSAGEESKKKRKLGFGDFEGW